MSGDLGGGAIAFEVFDEGIKAGHGFPPGDGGETDHVKPIGLIGVFDPTMVFGARAVGFGGNQKAIGFSQLPIEIEKRLPPRSFASKAANAHRFAFVEQFHPLLIRNGLGVVLLVIIPNGKEGNVFFVGEFLNAKVPLVPSYGTKVGSRGALLYCDFVKKRDGVFSRVGKVDRATGLVLQGFIGGD